MGHRAFEGDVGEGRGHSIRQSMGVEFAALLAVLAAPIALGFVGCRRPDSDAETRQISTAIHRSRLKSPAVIVAGATGGGAFVLHVVGQSPLFVWRDGERSEVALPAGFVEAFLPHEEGLVAVGLRGLLRLGPTGELVGSPALWANPPPGRSRAFAIHGGRIWVGSIDREGVIHIAPHGIDGTAAGEVIVHRAGGAAGELTLSHGPTGPMACWVQDNAIHLWRPSSSNGEPTSPLRLYSPEPGGALQRCSLGDREDGSTLLAWQDSSPGNWSPYALALPSSSVVDAPVRIGRRSRGDALQLTQPFGSAGRRVAWLQGIRVGMAGMSGVGRIALADANEEGRRPFLIDAPGSIESFAIALSAASMLAAGSVRAVDGQGETIGYDVYADILSAP